MVGYTVGHLGTFEVTNNWSKIYRLEKNTGEIVTVLDDITCSARMLYFMDNRVMIVGSKFIPDEKKATSNGACFLANTDENGMFTEPVALAD